MSGWFGGNAFQGFLESKVASVRGSLQPATGTHKMVRDESITISHINPEWFIGDERLN
jgi:hypothetical protein